MADLRHRIRASAAKFETPFLIRSVESHLVFGPLARHFPLAYIALGIAVAGLIVGVFATGEPAGPYIGALLHNLMLVFATLVLLCLTCRQQAVVGWLVVKLTFGVAAVMFATVGAGVSFHRGQADAWPNLFLGLIWIPGVEFIPKVTPYQRYVTLARVALSLPCIGFGLASGHWHW